MKKSKGVAIIAIILACLIGLGYYTSTIMSATSTSQKKTDNKTEAEGIKLGLDLSGGVSITYRIKDKNPSKKDINDTVAKLEERAESYSTEYAVYPVGDDRITVEIPGVYDANAVLEDLGSPGSLYFIVQKDSDGNENYSYDSSTGEYKLNYDIQNLVDNGSVIMDGNDVKSANAAYNQTSSTSTKEPVVQLTLKKKAADVFGEATTKAASSGESIGIYYDDHFISVPKVESAIKDGSCVINGMSDYDEAEQLATFIRVGAINLKLEEMESSVAGAQLGGKALSSSVKAAIIGLILVMLFMILNYSLSGIVASIGLAIYTTVTVALIYLFEITLTLPGIAGVILGIGMAVDANVIIISRIREEIAAGNMEKAELLLGYAYFVQGTVVHGNQIGRTIGIPTINLLPPQEKLLPPFGVYAARVEIDGKRYYFGDDGKMQTGFENIGDNPVGVETNLFDFHGDLYGKHAKVSLLKWVREEQKFQNVSELKVQMEKDIAFCRSFLGDSAASE